MRHYFLRQFNTVIYHLVLRHTAKTRTTPYVQEHRGLAAARLTVPKSGVFPLQMLFKSILFRETRRVAGQVAIGPMPATGVTNMKYLAAASLLAVFIINILTPPDFVIDILYVCSIVLVFRQNTKTILRFSAAACTMIVINALFFDVMIGHHMSLWVNRLISLIAIGITTYIAIHYRGQTEVSAHERQRYVTELEAMLFMMSHEVRKPAANILGLVEAIGANSAELSGADIQELCTYLRYSAAELDTFIESLNTFIEQTQKKHRGVAEHPLSA